MLMDAVRSTDVNRLTETIAALRAPNDSGRVIGINDLHKQEMHMPLHEAVLMNNEDMVQILLAAGADVHRSPLKVVWGQRQHVAEQHAA